MNDTKVTNADLLKTRPTLLGELNKQRLFVLLKLMTPMPCPNCATRQTYVQAAGLTVDTVDTEKSADDPCKCIGCSRQLTYTVPMMGGPCWTLVPIEPSRTLP